MKVTPVPWTKVMMIMAMLWGLGAGSEFPDRECCDSAPPPPPHYHTVTATSSTTTTTPRPHAYGVGVGGGGPGGERPLEHQTLNCLMAKQMCQEDANCSAILKVIPTLCGPELVACSTVTVSRCQAALRTLVQFSWFQPTCLCREPRLDPQCNAFRDLLFDHPCVFVSRKDTDMHPLQYIPTCEVAANICRDNPWCKQRLDIFRATCKFRDGKCRNPDREDCLKAWLQLRETPLLGCICPDSKDKKCARLYALVNENPCVVSDHNVSLQQLKYVSGTCQAAFQDCLSDPGCRSHLELLRGHCEPSYCHKDACRSSIQDIYKYLLETSYELALKIALCVCRNSGEQGMAECVRIQRQLHPPCAEMSETDSIRQCHSLGRDCRSDRICRYRLEHYELSCAADTVTGRCAGQHQECTKALLGLLGSDLHTNCVCKGNAFQDINQCLAWKRLIWGNPCVVETQLTYHLSKLGVNAELLIPDLHDYKEAEEEKVLTGEKTVLHQSVMDRGGNYDPQDRHHSSKDGQNDDDNVGGEGNGAAVPADDDGDDGGTRLQARKVASTAQSDHTLPHAAPAARSTTTTTTTSSTIISTTTATSTTTTITTTTTVPTTTLPERYCEVQRPWDSHSYIIEEGRSMRLYKNGDSDCSELCFCELHERTKCMVLECVEGRPCETAYAVFSHKSPAYQAKRGECVCYSGDFICQRPREDEFELPTGLFLMLGFSRTEEALLFNATKGSAVDALVSLQSLFKEVAAGMGELECGLELVHYTGENLVLQVRHVPGLGGVGGVNATYNLTSVQERDRCLGPAREVARMFQLREKRIRHDIHLSLFVLSEVVDNVPSPQRISRGSASVQACWWAWVAGVAMVLSFRLHAASVS